ncbi:MAG: outer membrane porin, OprD family [Candidatus Scalindua sp.]|jgi:hypothetical protein|nr:outer membrane porin, OprD family [Candidatus Scalindua sp.]MBT5305132.1 outer membrane porin, OprD family [Candidatus Scalindua sp.]MBT6228873.1 outer membrane porin, OprD family [Candidatus Scalindua sp.]MBT6562571.1 outer membrane porin, OprD family [Candidatus Scalindua sp.]MBT7211798.1 outer membrane porin, OprD family [Candidatus Scalindua sp.]
MTSLYKFAASYILAIVCLLFTTTSNAEDLFHSLKKAGYGKLTGQVQHLSMGRTRGGFDGFGSALGRDAHSGTIAFTGNYLSPEFQNFTLGLQYVHAIELYSRGGFEGDSNQAHNLSNSDFSLLNNAFISYDFKRFGIKDTKITIGRQSLDLNFVANYNIRQKNQAFEAIVFETKAIDKLAITMGHLEKFSSWTSRYNVHEGSTSNHFISIENVEEVPYSTNGFKFIETEFSGIPNTVLTVYDYFGHDLYNTIGSKIDYTINPNSELKFIPRFHYIKQWDVGRFKKRTGTVVKANAFQTGLKMTFKGFSVEPGIFKVMGHDPQNNLQVPFFGRYIINEPLFEIDLGFTGGSLSYFLESSYGWGKNSLYFLCLHTEQSTDLPRDGYSREFNLIYSRDITESAYFKIKLGNVEYHNHDTIEDGFLNEYRLFLGYRF